VTLIVFVKMEHAMTISMGTVIVNLATLTILVYIAMNLAFVVKVAV